MRFSRLIAAFLLPALFLFALFLIPGSFAFAQAAQPSFGQAGIEDLSGNHVIVVQKTLTLTGCPVSLRAQHGASGSLAQAAQDRPKGSAQLLHLTLTGHEPQLIVSARLRVHGLSGMARATQTLADSAKADAVRTLEARFSAAQNKTAAADLWVPAMTAVLKIDLISVTYADGSTRNFSAADGCRVTPDPLMLVSGR